MLAYVFVEYFLLPVMYLTIGSTYISVARFMHSLYKSINATKDAIKLLFFYGFNCIVLL